MNQKRVMVVLLIFFLVNTLLVVAQEGLPADDEQDLGPAGAAPSNDIPNFHNDPAQFSAWLNDPANAAKAYEYLSNPENYRDDFAAEFYSKQPDFATSDEHSALAQKFFSGGNSKSPEQIRRNFRSVAGEDGAASKYLSKKYNAPFVILTVGDDFLFEPAKIDPNDPESEPVSAMLTNNGKTVPLDAFDTSREENQNIERIETTPSGIIIVQRDGKQVSFEGQGKIQISYVDSTNGVYQLIGEDSSAYSLRVNDPSATFNIDEKGSISAKGASLQTFIDFDEIRLVGDFILHKDGSWDADDAIIHTRDVYVKGKSKREKFGEKWDYIIEPKPANTCQNVNQLSAACASVLVDKKTGIAVTAIQKTVVHMDQMVHYSQIAPPNLKTALASEQTDDQKNADEAAQKAAEDALKHLKTKATDQVSHVYINSDGLQTALRVEGPARIDHLLTERNIGFEPNARHPHKPVVLCESQNCIYDSLEVGVQTQFMLVGKGKYRDFEHNFETLVDGSRDEQGHVVGAATVTKHMALNPTERVPLTIECGDCQAGTKAISFSKSHTSLADSGFDVDPLFGQNSYTLETKDDGSYALRADMSSIGMLAAHGALFGSDNLATDAVLDLGGSGQGEGTDLLVRIVDANGQESFLEVGSNGEQQYTVTQDDEGQTILIGSSGVRVDSKQVFGQEVVYQSPAEKKRVEQLLVQLAKGNFQALESAGEFSPAAARAIAIRTQGLDLSNNDPTYRKAMVEKYQQEETARKSVERLEKRGYTQQNGVWYKGSGDNKREISTQELVAQAGTDARLYFEAQAATYGAQLATLDAQIAYAQSLGTDTSRFEEQKSELTRVQKEYHQARARIVSAEKAQREYQQSLQARKEAQQNKDFVELQVMGITLSEEQQRDRGLSVRIGIEYRDADEHVRSYQAQLENANREYYRVNPVKEPERIGEISNKIRILEAKLEAAKKQRYQLGEEMDAIAWKYSESDEADPVVLALVRAEDRRDKKRAEAIEAARRVAQIAPEAGDLLEARVYENAGNGAALRQVVARTQNPEYNSEFADEIRTELQTHNDKVVRQMYIEEYSHYMDIQDRVNQARRERDPSSVERIKFNNNPYNPLGYVVDGATYLSYGIEYVDKYGFNAIFYDVQDEENEAKVMWAAGGRLAALRNVQRQVADGKDITEITTDDIKRGVNPDVLDGQAGTVFTQHILCAKKAEQGGACNAEQRYRIAQARLEEKGELRAEIDVAQADALIAQYEGQEFTKGLEQERENVKNRAWYEGNVGRGFGSALTFSLILDPSIAFGAAGKVARVGLNSVAKVTRFEGLAARLERAVVTDVGTFIPGSYGRTQRAVKALEREDAIVKQVFVQSELTAMARKYADSADSLDISDVQRLKERVFQSGNREDIARISEIQQRFNIPNSRKITGDSFSRETADVLDGANNVISKRFDASDVIDEALGTNTLPKRQRELLDYHIDQYRTALAKGDIPAAENSGRRIVELGDEIGLTQRSPATKGICSLAIAGAGCADPVPVPSASREAASEMASRALPVTSRADASIPPSSFENELGGALVEGTRASHLDPLPPASLHDVPQAPLRGTPKNQVATGRPVPADPPVAPSLTDDALGSAGVTQPVQPVKPRPSSTSPDASYSGDIPLDEPFGQTILEGQPTLPNLERNTINMYIDADGKVKLLGDKPLSDLEGKTVVQGWVNNEGQILAVAPRKVKGGNIDASRAAQQEALESGDWLRAQAQVAMYNEHLVKARGATPVPVQTIDQGVAALGTGTGLRAAPSSAQVKKLDFTVNARADDVAARLHSTQAANTPADFQTAFREFEQVLDEYDTLISNAQSELRSIRQTSLEDVERFTPEQVPARLSKERELEEIIHQAKAKKSELTNSLFTSGLKEKRARGIISADLEKRIDTFRYQTSVDTARDIIKRDPIIRENIQASRAFERWRSQSPSRSRLTDKQAVDEFIDTQIQYQRIGTEGRLGSDVDIQFVAPDALGAEVYGRVKQRLDDILETQAQEIAILRNSPESLAGKVASEKLDVNSIRDPEHILGTPNTIRQWSSHQGRIPPSEAGPLQLEQISKLTKYRNGADARKIGKHGTRSDQARLLADSEYNKRLNDVVEQWRVTGRTVDLDNYEHVRLVMREAWLAGDIPDDVFIRFLASHNLYKGGSGAKGIAQADLANVLQADIRAIQGADPLDLQRLERLLEDPVGTGLPFKADGTAGVDDVTRFADARAKDALGSYVSRKTQDAMDEFNSLDYGNLGETVTELARVERRLAAGENKQAVLSDFTSRKKEIDNAFFADELRNVEGIDSALHTRIIQEYNHETLFTAPSAELQAVLGVDHRMVQRLQAASRQMNAKYTKLNHDVAKLRYQQTAGKSLEDSLQEIGQRIPKSKKNIEGIAITEPTMYDQRRVQGLLTPVGGQKPAKIVVDRATKELTVPLRSGEDVASFSASTRAVLEREGIIVNGRVKPEFEGKIPVDVAYANTRNRNRLLAGMDNSNVPTIRNHLESSGASEIALHRASDGRVRIIPHEELVRIKNGDYASIPDGTVSMYHIGDDARLVDRISDTQFDASSHFSIQNGVRTSPDMSQVRALREHAIGHNRAVRPDLAAVYDNAPLSSLSRQDLVRAARNGNGRVTLHLDPVTGDIRIVAPRDATNLANPHNMPDGLYVSMKVDTSGNVIADETRHILVSVQDGRLVGQSADARGFVRSQDLDRVNGLVDAHVPRCASALTPGCLPKGEPLFVKDEALVGVRHSTGPAPIEPVGVNPSVVRDNAFAPCAIAGLTVGTPCDWALRQLSPLAKNNVVRLEDDLGRATLRVRAQGDGTQRIPVSIDQNGVIRTVGQNSDPGARVTLVVETRTGRILRVSDEHALSESARVGLDDAIRYYNTRFDSQIGTTAVGIPSARVERNFNYAPRVTQNIDHNYARLTSNEFNTVAGAESVGGNAGLQKRAVNMYVDSEGRIVAIGNTQSLDPNLIAGKTHVTLHQHTLSGVVENIVGIEKLPLDAQDALRQAVVKLNTRNVDNFEQIAPVARQHFDLGNGLNTDSALIAPTTREKLKRIVSGQDTNVPSQVQNNLGSFYRQQGIDTNALSAKHSIPIKRESVEVGEQIGEGTVGVVYAGKIPGVEKDVVFKAAKPNPTRGTFTDNVDGILREFENAKEACQLVACPKYYGIYEIDGVPYLAMQRVEGRHLNDLVAEEYLQHLTPKFQQQFRSDLERLAQEGIDPHDAQVIFRDDGSYVFNDMADFSTRNQPVDTVVDDIFKNQVADRVTFARDVVSKKQAMGVSEESQAAVRSMSREQIDDVLIELGLDSQTRTQFHNWPDPVDRMVSWDFNPDDFVRVRNNLDSLNEANKVRFRQEVDLRVAAENARLKGNGQLADELEVLADQHRVFRKYNQKPWHQKAWDALTSPFGSKKPISVDTQVVEALQPIAQAG